MRSRSLIVVQNYEIVNDMHNKLFLMLRRNYKLLHVDLYVVQKLLHMNHWCFVVVEDKSKLLIMNILLCWLIFFVLNLKLVFISESTQGYIIICSLLVHLGNDLMLLPIKVFMFLNYMDSCIILFRIWYRMTIYPNSYNYIFMILNRKEKINLGCFLNYGLI